MNDDSPKRFDRIVAILIQLQSRRIVKARDLADRFDVSLRTIYRDIRTLEAAGVPLISEAGVGFSIMDGYRLPPVMFTREEASSFVAAEKLMKHFMDKNLGSTFESAMFKLKSILNTADKDRIHALENQVMILQGHPLFNDDIPDAMEILFGSIVDSKQVVLNYQSFESDQPTQRFIEPVGIFHENNQWYVMAYCHLRSDYRQFRTDRIRTIQRSDTSFTRSHGSIDQYRNEPQITSTGTRVVILVDAPVVCYLTGSRKYYGFVSERPIGKNVEMTFECRGTDEHFARWFMMFGDSATIVEPLSLKNTVLKMTKALIENQTKNGE